MSSLSNDQKNESRSSVIQRNGFYSYFSTRDTEVEKSALKSNPALLTAETQRARSCSPALLTPTPASWSSQCKTPPPIPETNFAPTTSSATTSATTAKTPATQSTTTSTTTASTKTTTSESAKAATATQTGMDRYIQIKRKLSPQSNPAGNKTKINRVLNNDNEPDRSTTNRFALLAEAEENQPAQDSAKKPKPPPIYIREKSSCALVNKIASLIGNGDNFHVVPLTKGNIHETKVQTKTEEHFRIVSKYLDTVQKNYYTYQLKSSKGLQVVVKGIEPDVTAAEIKTALKEKGFAAKNVINILNEDKKPQPLFKVELEPESRSLKKNEVHPIYNLQYLLHRKITVEEPHKRNGPVQCTNCQEYGHTRSYCTLRAVCVVCGDAHKSACCTTNKDSTVKKCGNCGGSHTANYRGCIVYKELKSRMRQATATRNQNPQNAYVSSKTTPDVFFAKAARSSFGPLNTTNGFSYADALRSGREIPIQPNSQSAQQAPEQPHSKTETMMLTLQQSMMELMSFMKTTMQTLVQNQNMVIQLLVAQQSK
ncbi:hypothetical protein KR074_000186 [Drosophila pseudoananassae]|nr:hypothetical protein KR074_000186 [Drosophila pseudoananassae]